MLTSCQILVVNSGSSFTCPTGTNKTKETFTVKAGETLGFSTNEAAKYGKNIMCKVDYRIDSSCIKLKLSCSKFRLGAGDFFYVKRDGRTRK